MKIRGVVGVFFVLGAAWLPSIPALAEPGRPQRPTAAELGLVPRTTYVQVPVPEARPGRPAIMFAPGDRNIIYLNRNGGRYEPGWTDDSVGNVSTIVQFGVDLAPYPYGDESWDRVLQCVRDLYAPFNVEVTDVDPEGTAHSEVVVSGHPNDIGMAEGVGGVAPMACQPLVGAVSFAFPETYGDNTTGICEAVGQESAHAFGLDHEMLCSDIMTYQSCGPKKFEGADSECGEFLARPCACGGETQNSREYLRGVLGPAARSDAPVITINSPHAGNAVEPGFGVDADISDDGTIVRFEMRIDNVLVDSRTEGPWELDAPDELTLGAHLLQLVATDDTNTEGVAYLDIEVVEDDGSSRSRSRGRCSVGTGAGAAEGSLPAGLVLLVAFVALALARRPS